MLNDERFIMAKTTARMSGPQPENLGPATGTCYKQVQPRGEVGGSSWTLKNVGRKSAFQRTRQFPSWCFVRPSHKSRAILSMPLKPA